MEAFRGEALLRSASKATADNCEVPWSLMDASLSEVKELSSQPTLSRTIDTFDALPLHQFEMLHPC